MTLEEELRLTKINWDEMEKDLLTLSYDLYDLPKPETAYDLYCDFDPAEMGEWDETCKAEPFTLTEDQRAKLTNMGYDLEALGL